ncbi:MAG: ATP-binding protein [Ginsengibacter sp.]
MKCCQLLTVCRLFFNLIVANTKRLNRSVNIKIIDNGNGITHDIIDKIFTTKPTGQGTGLGLSLAYDVIKAHGGEIKVESKEREGTEFIIQFLVV